MYLGEERTLAVNLLPKVAFAFVYFQVHGQFFRVALNGRNNDGHLTTFRLFNYLVNFTSRVRVVCFSVGEFVRWKGSFLHREFIKPVPPALPFPVYLRIVCGRGIAIGIGIAIVVGRCIVTGMAMGKQGN